MTISRRTFVQSATALGVLAALAGCSREPSAAAKPLDILVLGGTGFIGPHEIDYARARGHRVTMFNRGKTAPDRYPKVEALIGDRNGELSALKGRDWDAVIDNSGFFPRHAKLSAELLHGHVGKYMFVSSISAYGESLAVADDEFTAPPAEMDGPVDESEHIYGPTYGARKRLCEEEVNKVFGEDAIIVRPGIITGIGDPTERLRHWLRRMVAGGEILVPGEQDLPVQYIDAADMCAWMVRMLESGDGSGPYNAVGAEEPYRARPLLEGLIDATGSSSTLTWVGWDWIREQVQDVPSYAPWYGEGPIPFMQVNNDRALASGLAFRPIGDTANDMIANLDKVPLPERQAGFSLEKEAELLAKWNEERG